MTFPPLDPELEEVAKNLAPLGELLGDLSDVPPIRQALLDLARSQRVAGDDLPSVVKDVVSVDEENHQVPVWCYRPQDAEGVIPAIIWIHGGGFVLGSAEQDDLRAQALCAAANCAVFSVDYRLAPEHPYPAPLDDCYSALTWVANNADALNVDRRRIAVAGASAGGGLAAGLALLARDRGEVSLAFQLLLYPMLDYRNIGGDLNPPVWNSTLNEAGWRAYLGDHFGSDDVPVYASPTYAPNVEGLPPAFVPVGEVDLFVEENVAYARRLSQAGISTALAIYPGAFHGFDVFAPNAAVAQQVTADCTYHLKRHLFSASQ